MANLVGPLVPHFWAGRSQPFLSLSFVVNHGTEVGLEGNLLFGLGILEMHTKTAQGNLKLKNRQRSFDL